MKITCSRCGLESMFRNDELKEAIADAGWVSLDYWHSDLREYYLCPHCASEFNRFMRNESTGNESSPHVDSISKNIYPASYTKIDITAWCLYPKLSLPDEDYRFTF